MLQEGEQGPEMEGEDAQAPLWSHGPAFLSQLMLSKSLIRPEAQIRNRDNNSGITSSR